MLPDVEVALTLDRSAYLKNRKQLLQNLREKPEAPWAGRWGWRVCWRLWWGGEGWNVGGSLMQLLGCWWWEIVAGLVSWCILCANILCHLMDCSPTRCSLALH